MLTGLLIFISFHLHIVGDVLGARGPDGWQWPIIYFYPVSSGVTLLWHGQWALNGWPNFVITAFILFCSLYIGWKKGITPLEMISKRANDTLVSTLRQRFGEPTGGVTGEPH